MCVAICFHLPIRYSNVALPYHIQVLHTHACPVPVVKELPALLLKHIMRSNESMRLDLNFLKNVYIHCSYTVKTVYIVRTVAAR